MKAPPTPRPDKYGNMTHAEKDKALAKMESTINGLSAALIALVKLSKNQEILIPRHLIYQANPGDKLYVSMAGTRFCYKVNDKKPGEKQLIYRPVSFDENFG